MLEARKAGKIRHIGFTGHKDPVVHLRMLQAASENGFHFDAVQMPLNVMDAHCRSFQHQILPILVKEGIGVEAMKTFGDYFILESGTVQPIEALHYSMSLPASVVITGIDRPEILDRGDSHISAPGCRPGHNPPYSYESCSYKGTLRVIQNQHTL